MAAHLRVDATKQTHSPAQKSSRANSSPKPRLPPFTAGAPAKEAAEDLLRRASGNGAEVPAGSTPPTPGVDVGPKKEKFDGRAFRRSLGKTGRYVRTPVHDAASLALMEEHGVGYRCVVSLPCLH